MTICFVILHYMNASVTIECVNSILSTVDVDDFHIIIVDNASPNDSYGILKRYYGDEGKVTILQTIENVGFSKGNNIGYQYAKEKYNPKFIVVGNNDLIFEQEDFVQILEENWDKHPFHVAGPDIVDLAGNHQNPFREEVCSIRRIKVLNRNRKIMLGILKFKKYVHFFDKYDFIENWYFDNGKKRRQKVKELHKKEDIVLHGSCLVYSPDYIINENIAFQEYTFMYMEEDILKLFCREKGYLTIYLPNLRVKHKEMASTGINQRKNIDKHIFFFEECLKAGKIYLELLKKYDERRRI